jgi:hypothetical protein
MREQKHRVTWFPILPAEYLLGIPVSVRGFQRPEQPVPVWLGRHVGRLRLAARSAAPGAGWMSLQLRPRASLGRKP